MENTEFRQYGMNLRWCIDREIYAVLKFIKNNKGDHILNQFFSAAVELAKKERVKGHTATIRKMVKFMVIKRAYTIQEIAPLMPLLMVFLGLREKAGASLGPENLRLKMTHCRWPQFILHNKQYFLFHKPHEILAAEREIKALNNE